jgi:hypothetical protein
MKTSAIGAIAALLVASVGVHTSCFAGEKGVAGRPASALDELAGSAVPTAELNRQHARGSTNINTNVNVDTTVNADGSFNLGTLRGNSVVGPSATGVITTTNSINNNTGITTVFQNSGNNSLFQQSMAINITVQR